MLGRRGKPNLHTQSRLFIAPVPNPGGKRGHRACVASAQASAKRTRTCRFANMRCLACSRKSMLMMGRVVQEQAGRRTSQSKFKTLMPPTRRQRDSGLWSQRAVSANRGLRALRNAACQPHRPCLQQLRRPACRRNNCGRQQTSGRQIRRRMVATILSE